MTRHMTARTKAGVFAVFTFVTLTLAGCGDHNQATTSGGTMTPAQIQQNAQKQNEPLKSGGGQGTPPTPAAHP